MGIIEEVVRRILRMIFCPTLAQNAEFLNLRHLKAGTLLVPENAQTFISINTLSFNQQTLVSMKIAVMSCIHGNYEALNAVLIDRYRNN
ncbi:MAG: hypothetical protein F6K54_04625 [Okeania sp. SIO3B5]|uniref:hypothetical protein n=1 Tax=Okeania sp. SIO3B5 TaxID=2607811 RepID=UPI0013FF59EC|nr:hypothetical protein [Okeania sp. SIO3B5]NEO52424.1 hypothetical protein [Okeania sp. SIO3B5]